MLNGVMFQAFDWYMPADGALWRKLREKAPALASKGVTSVWIPPCYKAVSGFDAGYSTYDLWDLGEFDQKGTVNTKYGSKDELLAAIRALHAAGIYVYADVVLNHKAGADASELFTAVQVNPQNRNEEIGTAHEIEGWTRFTFPGRGGKYSDFSWNFNHFTGVDFDQKSGEKGVFRILGEAKNWAQDVSHEFGNYDYLMHADIDHRHPEVRAELFRWAVWFAQTLHLDGFRLDAVKHISASFIHELAVELRQAMGEDFYFVGEYWKDNREESINYLQETDFQLNLFDVPLHFNMYEASQAGAAYDLRRIFDDTMLSQQPTQAVTFVDNHDTEDGQSLASPIAEWFRPQAYALILLRAEGYPCVFYGDYLGVEGEHHRGSLHYLIDKLLLLRRHYANGRQQDYFERAEVIGWVRDNLESPEENLEQKLSPLNAAMAVLLSTQEKTQELRMFVGKRAAGVRYADFLGNTDAKIVIDAEGYGLFPVPPKSVSCFLPDGMPLDDLEPTPVPA